MNMNKKSEIYKIKSKRIITKKKMNLRDRSIFFLNKIFKSWNYRNYDEKPTKEYT